MMLFMSPLVLLRGLSPRKSRKLFVRARAVPLHKRLLSLTIATAFFLSSCATLDAILATPTFAIPTETPLPSPTYNWFPASATPLAQAFSTQIPTPEMRPGLGTITLTDSLTRPSLWDTATSDDGSAEMLSGQLNLAAQSKVFMYSLRHDLSVDNFYVEMIATPNLCRGSDTYGILVRANAVAYYRFSISCDGAVSAERNSVGKRNILQSPVGSNDAPHGAPGQVRIGVWAVGDEMRFFLNDHFQFNIIDATYPAGTIGVFVNSVNETPIIVSFSELTIRNVNYSPLIETPQP